MGWARTLVLGDIGNRLDIADTERDIGSLRRQLSNQHHRDASQDQIIARLERENQELELCLAALINALERKGIITQDEVENLVRMIDD